MPSEGAVASTSTVVAAADALSMGAAASVAAASVAAASLAAASRNNASKKIELMIETSEFTASCGVVAFPFDLWLVIISD